jgi:hypothetical protein
VFGSTVAAQLPGGTAAESAMGAGAEEITL